MTTNVGLWIDHRKAVLVFLSDSGSEELKCIESNVEKRVRSASGSRSKSPDGPQQVAPDNAIDRKFAQHLNQYYKEVIACLGEADSVLIIGPGEAKLELQKQIKSKTIMARIAAVEKSDKLTEPQLKARFRKFFQAPEMKK